MKTFTLQVFQPVELMLACSEDNLGAVLFLDGKELFSLSYEEMRKFLEETVPSFILAPRRLISMKEDGENFLNKVMEEGHEGVVAKDLRSVYEFGRRVKSWLKVKPALSLCG